MVNFTCFSVGSHDNVENIGCPYVIMILIYYGNISIILKWIEWI
jgi:hypothetical protein